MEMTTTRPLPVGKTRVSSPILDPLLASRSLLTPPRDGDDDSSTDGDACEGVCGDGCEGFGSGDDGCEGFGGDGAPIATHPSASPKL
ncbi:unnamed protein product [Linum trigynum]|uniref:Uncharacterized protein n=1 Tax=Linum trigynum TaxID=586398 RepID=A0AAV2GR57_9ROSI